MFCWEMHRTEHSYTVQYTCISQVSLEICVNKNASCNPYWFTSCSWTDLEFCFLLIICGLYSSIFTVLLRWNKISESSSYWPITNVSVHFNNNFYDRKKQNCDITQYFEVFKKQISLNISVIPCFEINRF